LGHAAANGVLSDPTRSPTTSAILEHADAIITAGLWLSGVAFLVVAATLWNLWRRASLPEVAYGGVSLTPRRVRWLWTGALLGATLLGSANEPIVRSSVDTNDPDAEAVASLNDQTRRKTTTMPLPFYRYEKEEISRGGITLNTHELRGFVLPSELLWVLLAYVFLVIRFNPDSWWTRRFLHGRKRRWAREEQAG
jgi:hypothetical protein